MNGLDRAKHLATLKARCALAGVALIESTDDRGRPVFVVSEGSWTRQIDDVSSLERWVEMRTGRVQGAVPA